jgi:transcriptional regulator with XRE-family HTH domain
MELGERIRERRREQSVTLDELSRRSGVSKSLLSQVERSISVPTVRTLERILSALDTTVSALYLELENSSRAYPSGQKVAVVRKSQRKRVLLGPERGRARYELLTPDYQRKIEFVYIHLPVGGKYGKFISHEGEECGILLEGRLKVHLEDRVIILEEGDSIYYDSAIPHRLENIGEVEVRAFWANTPPTF